MAIPKMTKVECLNEECEKEFKTTCMKNVGEVVKCTHCNSEHLLDNDDHGDGEFWYLHSLKPITQK